MRLRVIGACAGLAAVVIAGLVWANWARIAVAVAPKKVAAQSRSEAARQADELFWQTLHRGRYEGIQTALEFLTAAYLQTPDDAVTTAHIAWLHVWRVSERTRLTDIPATITDDIRVSRRYFQEAVELNSSDARYLGFLASMTLAEGTIDKEEATLRRGYFMLLEAIRVWPEFNLFTGGYVLSQAAVELRSIQGRPGMAVANARLMRRREDRPCKSRLRQVHDAGNQRRAKAGVLEFLDCPAQF